MIGIGFGQQAVGTAETILGAMHLPFAPQYRSSEQGVILRVHQDLSNGRSEDGVRLKGFLNQHTKHTSKGLVLIIHGWLGSSHTPDTIHLGSSLFEAGFDTFRINLRDHGSSLPLNRGLFHGGLIDELVEAAAQVSLLSPHQNFYVVGSSLGGNYALRLGLKNYAERIPNLKKIIAVCPAINPENSATLIDKNPLFRKFFCYLWLRALRNKEKHHPDFYSFKSSDLYQRKSVHDITNFLFSEYFEFSSLDEYYKSYAIDRARLDDLVIRSTVLASHNDPVIYIEDFEALAGAPNLTLDLLEKGGHIGFVNPIKLQRYLSTLVVNCLT